jgi:hypothetical protein
MLPTTVAAPFAPRGTKSALKGLLNITSKV